jgi:predicted nucleic acid-binding protein
LSEIPLTYIDSNILISYVLGPKKEPKQFPLAEQFFKGIAGDRYKGLLSYLVCSEVLEVFRSMKAKEFAHLLTLDSDDARTEYVLREASKLYGLVVGEIVKIPEIIWMPDLTTNVTSLLGTAVEILSNTRGSVRSFNQCKKCGSSSADHYFSSHKCVGTADVLHALLAKEFKCDRLATFDKGFKELIGNPTLKGLEIWVLE